MARSTRTSLAGQAASAARKIVGRRPATDEAEDSAPSARKASPKQAPAKKAPAKKAPATTKTTAKKAPAKKAPAAKAAAAESSARPTATAKAAAAKQSPAKKAPAKKAPAKKAPVKKAAATKAAPATKAPAKKAAPTKKAAPATKAAPAKAAAKKSATKKAPVSSLVVKADEEAWTKEELAEVLAELHEQREHSAAIVAAQEAELSGLMRDAGDGAGHDQADLGATSFERDHELTVLNNERDKLAQIERALLRIDDGSYGQCESCGNPIGKMRLMAFPRATLCLTCKQREERR